MSQGPDANSILFPSTVTASEAAAKDADCTKLRAKSWLSTAKSSIMQSTDVDWVTKRKQHVHCVYTLAGHVQQADLTRFPEPWRDTCGTFQGAIFLP